jgi:DNA-binding GntR family transcriptional regulator
MTQQPGSGQPKYMAIAGDLREKIAGGLYDLGTKLPPVHEMGEMYGAAPNTIRSAITVLAQEGVLESFQGDGVYVRSVPAGPPQDVAAQLAGLRERIEEVSEQAGGGDGAVVLGRIGAVEAALMDLYAKLGYEYPGKVQQRQRKAAGS